MSQIEVLTIIAVISVSFLIEMVRNPKNNPYYGVVVTLLTVETAFVVGMIIIQVIK